MRPNALIGCLVLTQLGIGISLAQEVDRASFPAPSADHHAHLRSPLAAEAWIAFCTEHPQFCSGDGVTALHADDLVRAMDEGGVRRAAVLSIGYFFGLPEMAGSPFAATENVRRENRFVADEVARYPDRLVGFFSVNPLDPHAVDEATYWARQGLHVGMKLHLANSAVDLLDQRHREGLADVLSVAEAYDLVVLLHLRTRSPTYGAPDVEAFLDIAATVAPTTVFQIAHAGGWGGYDQATEDALSTFDERLRKGTRLEPGNFWFDLTAVCVAGDPQIPFTGLWRFAREIGLDRFLAGSDWNAFTSPGRSLDFEVCMADLTDAELSGLATNVHPYFDRQRESTD